MTVTFGFLASSNLTESTSEISGSPPCAWKIFGVDLGIGDIDLGGYFPDFGDEEIGGMKSLS
jgi:hypothetical protein